MSPADSNQTTITSAEAELLLCCARNRMDPETAGRIKALLCEELDWKRLIATALQHRIVPLFCWHISNTCPEAVPNDILDQLKVHFENHTAHNALLSESLVEILDLFEQHQIPVIPYKGPVLATIVYGSFSSLRQFRDLDILVHKQDVLRAKDLLMSQGYRPLRSLSPEEEGVELKSGYMYKFLHPEGVEVELHWGFTSRRASFPVNLENIWTRLEPVYFKGKQVLSFTPEDLILLLCVHMARHSARAVFWIRLQMICDIAELIRVNHEINWTEVMERAVKLRSRRMLFFGLLAASVLLGADLPEQVVHRLHREKSVKLLVSQLREKLFYKNDESPWKGVEALVYYLRTRESWLDRIRYLIPVVGELLTPNAKDRAILPLPSFLSFLYYIVRPIRLLSTYGFGPLQRKGIQNQPKG